MVQLYSERGLGSGAGQVEAETASLAKVTFTSEQFISLGLREEVSTFYFHCSKMADWRGKRDTVETWGRLRLGAQHMLLQYFLTSALVPKGVFPLLRRLLAGGGTEQRAGQSLRNLHWATSRRAGL